MNKRILSFEGLSVSLPPVGEKFGIEHLGELVRFAAKAKEKITEWKADGQYSFWEKVGTMALIGKLIPLAADGQSIVNEFRDLDEEETNALVDLATDELGFEVDAANSFIREYMIDLLFAILAMAKVVEKS